jgi:hypothetical protein
MRVAVEGQFLAMLGKRLANQPAEIADREPDPVQVVFFEGKVPQVRASIQGVQVGLPQQDKPGAKVGVDRRSFLFSGIIDLWTVTIGSHGLRSRLETISFIVNPYENSGTIEDRLSAIRNRVEQWLEDGNHTSSREFY